MSAQENLWAFDRLARSKGIDAGLQSAANESQDANPGYVICVQPDFSPSRTRCLLTVKNQSSTKLHLGGSFEVVGGDGDTVDIKRSHLWTNNGNPFDIATLDADAITEAEIRRLALDFINDFFRQVRSQPE
jgi:hypothetical protein